MTQNPPRLALVIGWPWTQEKFRLAKQLGVSDIVGGPPVQRGQPRPDVWEFLPLLHQKKMAEDVGLRLEVIESNPPMDEIIFGLPGRDRQIENFCKTLRNMGAAGYSVLAHSFTSLGWVRTSLAKPTRGDAQVTAFDYDLMKNAPLTEHGVVTEDQIWENWTYFIEKVVPVAEEAKVHLALHPDDPPISPIRGISRAFRSVDAFKRVIETVDSDYNGLEFCQGCFSEMGADVPETIRYFGKRKKIFYVHFRDVMGTAAKFEETFHDAGQTDMAAAMRAYKEVGFDGPMRPDHVPTMEGDDRFMGGHAGYTMLGRLYAIGYMKGLIDAIYGKQ
ncbi:MAG: mannonate dehydratase [Candidatus Bathyarchaeota archaeon]|nr:mannonate dehydratase [Candidatus Bathyarchaeota archaeon]